MADNTAETVVLAEAMVRITEPLGLKSIIDFIFKTLLRTGMNSREPTKIMDCFVALLQPWLAAEGQTFADVDARPQTSRAAQPVTMLNENIRTKLQELETLVQEIIDHKRRPTLPPSSSSTTSTSSSTSSSTVATNSSDNTPNANTDPGASEAPAYLPDEYNEAVRIKLVSVLYCQLFRSLVDVRFGKAKAEMATLGPKIRDVKNAGCEFFCCLFRCTEGKDLDDDDLDRVMFNALEFVTALIAIRFTEGEAEVGDWWWLANEVEKHGCGLLWVLINLRFSPDPCVAPRKYAEPKDFNWYWGGPGHGNLQFNVNNEAITRVTVFFDMGNDNMEILE